MTDSRRYPRDFPWPPASDEDYRQEAVVRAGGELADRFAQVRLVVLDADGVLTSGHMVYGAQGEAFKSFHSRDGLGLVLARAAGLKLAVLTGRNSAIVERRCSELRFDVMKLGRFDKVDALGEILDETDCAAEETLYMGDDVIDLPALYQVGVPVAVPCAPQEVRHHCVYVTQARGGEGAVREVIDLVLKSAGIYGQALERLRDKAWQPTRSELSSDHGRDPELS
ncbi:MAG: HAD hydrolase family protein [bacterium]|nr:HAD hydrolase family protein [bacterium]